MAGRGAVIGCSIDRRSTGRLRKSCMRRSISASPAPRLPTSSFGCGSERAAPEATDPDPTQEPLTLAKIGGPIVRLHAAEALLQRAGQPLDFASADPTPRRIADGGIATAEATIAGRAVAGRLDDADRAGGDAFDPECP